MKQNVQQAFRLSYFRPAISTIDSAFNYGLMNQSTFVRLPAAGSRPYFRGEWQPKYGLSRG